MDRAFRHMKQNNARNMSSCAHFFDTDTDPDLQ
jgi:hypothetical protein